MQPRPGVAPPRAPGAGQLPPEPSAAGAGALAGAPTAATDAPLQLRYSPYEVETIRRALARLDASIDSEPEGKIIEGIEIIPLEVFEDRDPAPAFVNWFHSTSRPFVLRREMLLRSGEPYRQVLADETARNLRGRNQLSLVLVFPVRGSSPDRVRMVVVTKDVWSLRLNSNYRFAAGRLEYLLLQPSEQNLLGTHNSIAAQMLMDPATVSLGGSYTMPYVGGSRIVLSTDANVILGRDSGEVEGSFGSFSYGQPLYATIAEWSWGAVVSWREEITRRFVAGQVATFDADATPEEDDIPFRYRSSVLGGSYTVTRSFGRLLKNDFSLGIQASRRVYRAGDLSNFDPDARREFLRRAVPTSDTRIGPAFEYHTYSAHFRRVLDLNTLGLQEDFRIGHDVSLKLYPVLQGLGSTRNFAGVAVAAGYTVPLGDGLARLVVESVTEAEPSRIADGSIQIAGRIHTPHFGIGRLVFDAVLMHRYRNYMNRLTQLGGESRLRGYATGEFIGPDMFAANLEFRSVPLEIWSVQLAGAAFFDVGDAFRGFDDFRVKQSTGVGLRILFPQLDRTVIRADWGFPLTRGYVARDSFPGDIIVTFGQAFQLPAPSVSSL
ncbi:BamA/TamA family outer membrane protein [Chondromyces crocatus]|uniref:Membrane protein n=1 Tax=Chondromyces crocatus TaxID=52 RepID=A0A0K1ECZ2_CHOCO|nr:BamA/TamA family outer membrane protein [Chondromyces crocatus]AKT38741.1 membrane protein [Chondromyces crocatus]